jgi:hypothetical protein
MNEARASHIGFQGSRGRHSVVPSPGGDDGTEISRRTVDMLERRVELLEQLPERVTALEAQIVLLRDELRVEFSATRSEARVRDEETRRFMRILYEDLVARLEVLGGKH